MSVFCRVAADKDGRWWAVDGAGRRKIVAGVDHVRYQGFYSDALGFAPYGKNNAAKYPHRSDWEQAAIDRIRKWGFTALGTGCDASLYGRGGLLYNVPLSFGHHLCRQKDPDLWIVPENRAPCSYIPNMFHPGFAAYADARAKELCAPRRGEKNLLGYFLDNELVWWGADKSRPLADGLYDTVAKLPAGHSARKALETFKEKRGPDKTAFLAYAAEKYFSVLTAAVRKYDPNHLILGVRFAGFNGAHPVVIKACGRYCDIVSVNSYPRADLDRNVVEAWSGGRYRRIDVLLDELHSSAGKPVLITEWSFMALDSGCPCTYATGQRFYTQSERAAAAELFIRTVLSVKGVIGYNFFAWMDDPKEGTSRTCPENGNYGLVSITDEPYAELTSMFAKAHENMAALHCMPAPKERTGVAAGGRSTAERFHSEAVKSKRGRVGCDMLPYRSLVLTGCGFEVETRRGAGEFPVLRLDGEIWGTYAAMVQLKTQDGKSVWAGARKVESIDWRMAGQLGVMTLTGRYSAAESAFKVTHRLTFAPGFNGFLAEVVSVENAGHTPLTVVSALVQVFPPKGVRRTIDRGVPELWKGPNICSWVYPGKGVLSARTWDKAALRIRFWEGPGAQPHGDVMFRTGKEVRLGIGESWRPEVPMGVLVHCRR